MTLSVTFQQKIRVVFVDSCRFRRFVSKSYYMATCLQCGKDIPQSSTKPKKYCDNKCKQKHKRALDKQSVPQEAATIQNPAPITKTKSSPAKQVKSSTVSTSVMVIDHATNQFRDRLPNESAIDYAFAKNEWKKKQLIG